MMGNFATAGASRLSSEDRFASSSGAGMLPPTDGFDWLRVLLRAESCLLHAAGPELVAPL